MRGFAIVAAVSMLVAAADLASPAAKGAGRSAARPRVAEDPARFFLGDSVVETRADFIWEVSLNFDNPTGSGLYLDSLLCDVDDLDPGATRVERHSRINLTNLLRLMPAIGAGIQDGIQHMEPATAEHARLTYHLFCHRSLGPAFERVAVVEAKPGSSQAYASQFLEVGGKKIEFVIVPALGGVVSAPGLLMVHDHGSNARHMIRQARGLATLGYTVAVVSMPGYGASEGPAEMMGPASVEAASRTLDALERAEGVDSTRIAAWGVARGATVVAELAARRKDLRAVVLEAGSYDLWATYRETKLDGFREAIVAEAGTDSAAWRERSPLLRADRIGAPVFVVHGEQDATMPVTPAHALAAALGARGAKVESRFFPAAGHRLPASQVQRAVLDFLGRQLGR